MEDIEGVLLSNGWDYKLGKLAIDHFHLEADEMDNLNR